MRLVYAVEHGEYSSRTTLCLFEAEEAAKGYIEALWDADDRREAADEWGWRMYGERDSDDLRIVTYQLWEVVPVVSIPEWAGAVEDGIEHEDPRG